MNSRERILAAMRFEEVDRVPVSPWGTGHVGLNSPLGQELLQKTDLILEVGVGGDPVIGSAADVEYIQDGNDTITIIHTPKGDLRKTYRRNEITGADVEFFLKELSDVEKMLSIPYEPPKLDLTQYWDWREKFVDEALVMTGTLNGVAVPASWFSPEGFCLAWMDAPELVEKMTAIMTERLNDNLERLCKEGVDAFRIIGGEYASVQLGPEGFKRLCVKHDRVLMDTIHRYGGVAHYHNHGPVKRYLEDFAAIGFDCVDPLEAAPWGDADLREARRIVGDRFSFLGNLDDMEQIGKLPMDECVALARERLEAAGNRGFLLGGTTSGTYNEHAARNFIAMAEMVANR